MIIAKQEHLDFIANVVSAKSRYWCLMIEEIYEKTDFDNDNFIVINISDPDPKKRIWFTKLYTIGFNREQLYLLDAIVSKYFRPRVVIYHKNESYSLHVRVTHGENVFFNKQVTKVIHDIWKDKNNPTRHILSKEYVYKTI